MHKQITVTLDKDVVLVIPVAEYAHMGHDSARVWLDHQFTVLHCVPLRATGRVTTADKILLVTQAAGIGLLQDPNWAHQYGAAVSASLGKPIIRVDVPLMAISS